MTLHQLYTALVARGMPEHPRMAWREWSGPPSSGRSRRHTLWRLGVGVGVGERIATMPDAEALLWWCLVAVVRNAITARLVDLRGLLDDERRASQLSDARYDELRQEQLTMGRVLRGEYEVCYARPVRSSEAAALDFGPARGVRPSDAHSRNDELGLPGMR